MEKDFSLKLSRIWLAISLFSLILPIFLPSSANSQNFLENVIGTVTVTMFILSFPSSLFGLPIMFFAQHILEVAPKSIESLYLNLFLLFVFGLVQWFWIFPRILLNEPRFQTLNLLGGKKQMPLLEANAINNIEFFDSQGQTPLERVFRDKSSE